MRHLETRNELHFPHSSGLLYAAFTYYTASSSTRASHSTANAIVESFFGQLKHFRAVATR